MSYATLAHMFDSLSRKYDAKVLIRAIEHDSIVEFSWKQVYEKAITTALSLKRAGINPGEHVAIISVNRPHWIFADLGIMLAGAVSVPIYPTHTPDTIAHILKETEAGLVFVDTETTALRVLTRMDFLKDLKQIVVFDETIKKQPPMVSFADFLMIPESRNAKRMIRHEYLDLGPEDIHTIIYTPGISGLPKGVMLNNKNIISNCSDAALALPLLDSDEFMSYLDLSHAFERTAGYYTAMYVGATINFPQSPGTILNDMKRLKPTVMCSVPYFFNIVRPRMESLVQKKVGTIGRFALRMNKHQSKIRTDKTSFFSDIMSEVTDKLVYHKIRDLFGGNLRFFVSGSAPLPVETAKFFHAFGIMILEGYGLTEAGPVVSVNRVDKFKFGSVGLPLRNAKLNIATDGEILVKGPNVMQGYFKRPEETTHTFTEDGWLKTGDTGELDSDGFLYITDRKKDLIKTSTGKLIAPQEIETKLLEIPYIERAVLIGEGFSSMVAVLFPAFPLLRSWARQKNLSFNNNKDLIVRPEIVGLFKNTVKEINSMLAPFERIGSMLLVDSPANEFKGIFSPSLRADRKVVAEQLSEQLHKSLITIIGESNGSDFKP